VLEDVLASATATALQLSSSGVKQLARAGGISSQSASRWRIRGRGNPLYDITAIIYRLMACGQHAGAIVAHTMAVLHQSLMPTSDADLVHRFWSLIELESEAEGRENKATGTFGLTGDLEGLERATLDEAGYAVELAACCRELRRRRIDPRTWDA